MKSYRCLFTDVKKGYLDVLLTVAFLLRWHDVFLPCFAVDSPQSDVKRQQCLQPPLAPRHGCT